MDLEARINMFVNQMEGVIASVIVGILRYPIVLLVVSNEPDLNAGNSSIKYESCMISSR